MRLPAERAGGEAFWPPAERLDAAAMVPAEMAKREAAIASEASEATKVGSALEEVNRLSRGAPEDIGRLMGMTTDTAALRPAAQRLVDAIEDDETRSGGLISRRSRGAAPSCG